MPETLPPDVSLMPQIPAPGMSSYEMVALAWQIGPALLGGVLVGLGLTFGRRHLLAELRKRYGGEVACMDIMFWAFNFLQSLRVWFIWITALLAAVRMAPPAAPLYPLADFIFTLLALLQVGLMFSSAIKDGGRTYVELHKQDGAKATLVSTMVMVVKMLLWAILALCALGAMGINVTALVAGLGVGGVVIALGLKNIAADIMSSLSIVFDQPFVLGDFITVGDVSGTVEKIGMKTTRIRALSGELVIMPNSDLLGGRIRNFGRMIERRQAFNLSVVYQTPREKLEKIPALVKGAVEAQDKVRFDRCHLAKIGTYSLDFEVVYFVLSADYGLYMDVQQAINLAVLTGLEEEGVQIAYPTQVMVGKEDKGFEAKFSEKVSNKLR